MGTIRFACKIGITNAIFSKRQTEVTIVTVLCLNRTN